MRSTVSVMVPPRTPVPRRYLWGVTAALLLAGCGGDDAPVAEEDPPAVFVASVSAEGFEVDRPTPDQIEDLTAGCAEDEVTETAVVTSILARDQPERDRGLAVRSAALGAFCDDGAVGRHLAVLADLAE
jgi:hypothetical protein